jgi:hypothetical protein
LIIDILYRSSLPNMTPEARKIQRNQMVHGGLAPEKVNAATE